MKVVSSFVNILLLTLFHSIDLAACNRSPIEVHPAENVTLQSPGYPNRYEPDTTCEWQIIAPPGYDIAIYLEVLYSVFLCFSNHA